MASTAIIRPMAATAMATPMASTLLRETSGTGAGLILGGRTILATVGLRLRSLMGLVWALVVLGV